MDAVIDRIAKLPDVISTGTKVARGLHGVGPRESKVDLFNEIPVKRTIQL